MHVYNRIPGGYKKEWESFVYLKETTRNIKVKKKKKKKPKGQKYAYFFKLF